MDVYNLYDKSVIRSDLYIPPKPKQLSWSNKQDLTPIERKEHMELFYKDPILYQYYARNYDCKIQFNMEEFMFASYTINPKYMNKEIRDICNHNVSCMKTFTEWWVIPVEEYQNAPENKSITIILYSDSTMRELSIIKESSDENVVEFLKHIHMIKNIADNIGSKEYAREETMFVYYDMLCRMNNSKSANSIQ